MVRFPVPQKERKKTKGSADDDAKAIKCNFGFTHRHSDREKGGRHNQSDGHTNNRTDRLTDRLIYIILMMKYVKKKILCLFLVFHKEQ